MVHSNEEHDVVPAPTARDTALTSSHPEPQMDAATAWNLLTGGPWHAVPLKLRPCQSFRLLLGIPPGATSLAELWNDKTVAGARGALADFMYSRMRMLSDWAVGTPNTDDWIDSYTPPPTPQGGVKLNLSQLARSMAHAALTSAYVEACQDVFEPVLAVAAPSALKPLGNSKSATPPPETLTLKESLAQRVLRQAVSTAEPAVFSAVLTSFIAHGVDFSQAGDVGTGSSRLGTTEAPLLARPRATLHMACWQLHRVVVGASYELQRQIKTIEDVTSLQELSITRSFLRSLINIHSLLSLLHFYAHEQAAPVTTSQAAVRPYTVAAFNQLLHDEKSAREDDAREQRTTQPSAEGSATKEPLTAETLLYCQLQDVCVRTMDLGVTVLNEFGCRWSLEGRPDHIEEVRQLLSVYPPTASDSLRVIAQLCEDFPPLREAVVWRGLRAPGGEAPAPALMGVSTVFRVQQLLNCGVLGLPPTSPEVAAVNRRYDPMLLATPEGRRAMGVTLVPTPPQPPNIGGPSYVPLPDKVATRVYMARGDKDAKDNSTENEEGTTTLGGYQRRLLRRFHATALQAAAAAASAAAKPSNVSALEEKRLLKQAYQASTGATATNVNPARFTDVFNDTSGFNGADGATNVTETVVGLQNLGNTCFLNSVTQLLFRASGFTKELLESTIEKLTRGDIPLDGLQPTAGPPGFTEPSSGTQGDEGSGVSVKIKLSLMVLLTEMQWRVSHGHSKLSVHPEFFTTSLPAPFNDHHQHDASEFSKFLLEQLDTAERREATSHARTTQTSTALAGSTTRAHDGADEECASSAAAPPRAAERGEQEEREEEGSTIVSRWFGGTMVTDMRCLVCLRQRSHVNPFWDCSLPIRTSNPTAAPSASVRREEITVTENTFGTAVSFAEVDSTGSLAVNSDAGSERSSFGSCRSHSGASLVKDEPCGSADAADRPATPPSVIVPPPAPGAAPRATVEPGTAIQSLVDKVCDPANNAETLDGDNCLTCEGCGHRTPTALSTRIIGRGAPAGEDSDGIPHFLTLQLNRFQYNRARFDYEKILDPVWLDEVISFPVCVRTTEGAASEEEEEEQGGSEGNALRDEELQTRRLARFDHHRRVLYRLKAFIVHSGSTPMSGHYFTLVKAHSACLTATARARERAELMAYTQTGTTPTPRQADAEGNGRPLQVTTDFYDNWLMLNDSNVRRLKSSAMEGILSGACGVFSHLETPYIVLYERLHDPNPYAAAATSPFALTPRTMSANEEAAGAESHARDVSGPREPSRLPHELQLNVDVPEVMEREFQSRVQQAGKADKGGKYNITTSSNVYDGHDWNDGSGTGGAGSASGGGYGMYGHGAPMGHGFAFGGGYIPP